MTESSLGVQIWEILEEPEISIKQPHPIRRLELRKAVHAVFVSYSSVLATIEKFVEDTKRTAKGLHKYINNYKVALNIHACCT